MHLASIPLPSPPCLRRADDPLAQASRNVADEPTLMGVLVSKEIRRMTARQSRTPPRIIERAKKPLIIWATDLVRKYHALTEGIPRW
jgi:hypothetical protein